MTGLAVAYRCPAKTGHQLVEDIVSRSGLHPEDETTLVDEDLIDILDGDQEQFASQPPFPEIGTPPLAPANEATVAQRLRTAARRTY